MPCLYPLCVGMLYLDFHLSQSVFNFSFYLSMTHRYLVAHYLILTYLWVLDFFLLLILTFITLWLEHSLGITSPSLLSCWHSLDAHSDVLILFHLSQSLSIFLHSFFLCSLACKIPIALFLILLILSSASSSLLWKASCDFFLF